MRNLTQFASLTLTVSLLGPFACNRFRGGEGEQCTAYETCDAGLTCKNQVCVKGTTTSSGGSPSSGGADTTNSGGSDASGGQDSQSGGSNSTGGSDAATGGETSSGGAASGGSDAGTGGDAASGGSNSTGPVDTGLIDNGDFESGEDPWVLNKDGGSSAGSVQDGAFCVEAGSFTLDYPEPGFALADGTTYDFSYKVWGDGTFRLKVGRAVSPYEAVLEDEVTVNSAGADLQTGELSFGGGMDSTGIRFEGTLESEQTLCFDEVTVKAQ